MSDLATRNAGRLGRRGTPFTINGHTVYGKPSRAQPNRVTQFEAETLNNAPAYEVVFPASVVNSSTSLTNGLTITWQRTGYTFIVRDLNPIDTGGPSGEIVSWTAYIEQTSP